MSRWIEVGKMRASIDRCVIGWLDNGEKFANEAMHVLLPWIRSNSNGTIVKTFALEWLAHHSSMMCANFILAAWIKRSYPLGEIRDY